MIFEGDDKAAIEAKGIFNSNKSYAQYDSSPGEVGVGLRVKGLPVFFHLEEALYWIKGKTFLKSPAIIRVWVNMDSVAGDNKQAAEGLYT